MSLLEQVKQAGVVGAGGGGFPAHVKLAAKADTVIANGAECEPLLHKDAAVMEHHAAEVVAACSWPCRPSAPGTASSASRPRRKHAVEAVEAACKGTPVRVQLLGDYYPAGDEYDLVYAVTGRLIPPQGIPAPGRRRRQQRRDAREHRRRRRRQAGHAQDAHHRRRGEQAGHAHRADRHDASASASTPPAA